jgi:hypothetical protein
MYMDVATLKYSELLPLTFLHVVNSEVRINRHRKLGYEDVTDDIGCLVRQS